MEDTSSGYYETFISGSSVGGIIGHAGLQEEDVITVGNSVTDNKENVIGGETISYVHNYGTVTLSKSTDEENQNALGLLIGKAAYQVSVSDAYAAVNSLNSSSSSDGETNVSGSGSTVEASSAVGVDTGLTEDSDITELLKERFLTGEVAYLLDHEDGSTAPRNVWTQEPGSAYPTLGTPPVSKVSGNSDEYGVVYVGKSETSVNKDVVYAVSGETILVFAEADMGGGEVSYRTDSVRGDGGTWYYRYQIYKGWAVDQITVEYDNGVTETFSGNSFTMSQDSDAVVSATYSLQDGIETLVESWFVPDEVESDDPIDTGNTDTGSSDTESSDPETPDDGGSGGDGSGGGSGEGSGPGTGSGTEAGDGEGEGGEGSDPGGTQNGSSNGTTSGGSAGTSQTNVPQVPVSGNVIDPVSVILPASVEAVSQPLSDTQTEAEEAEPPAEAAEDSGGGGDPEESELYEEELPEESSLEDLSVFEVIQDTVRENPWMMILLLIAQALLIAVGGYSRYRKSRGDRMFK